MEFMISELLDLIVSFLDKSSTFSLSLVCKKFVCYRNTSINPVYSAAYDGNENLLKWLMKEIEYDEKEAAVSSVEGESISCIDMFPNHNGLMFEKSLQKGKYLSGVHLEKSINFKTRDHLNLSLEGGNKNLIEHIYGNRLEFLSSDSWLYAIFGGVNSLEWLDKKIRFITNMKMMFNYIEGHNLLDSLRWFINKGYIRKEFDTLICSSKNMAIFDIFLSEMLPGRKEVIPSYLLILCLNGRDNCEYKMKKLIELGAEVNKDVLLYTIIRCSCSFIESIIGNYKDETKIVEAALQNRDISIVKLLIENGYKMRSNCFSLALRINDTDKLQLLMESGCPYDGFHINKFEYYKIFTKWGYRPNIDLSSIIRNRDLEYLEYVIGTVKRVMRYHQFLTVKHDFFEGLKLMYRTGRVRKIADCVFRIAIDLDRRDIIWWAHLVNYPRNYELRAEVRRYIGY